MNTFAKFGISYTSHDGYVHISEKDFEAIKVGVQAELDHYKKQVERLQSIIDLDHATE